MRNPLYQLYRPASLSSLFLVTLCICARKYPAHVGVRDSALLYLIPAWFRSELLCSLGKTLLMARARIDALMRSRMWATAGSAEEIEDKNAPLATSAPCVIVGSYSRSVLRS